MRARDSKLSMHCEMVAHLTSCMSVFVSVLAGAETVSAPGGAGHALQFRDHVLLKKDFKVWVVLPRVQLLVQLQQGQECMCA
jgi:hypothetical protein